MPSSEEPDMTGNPDSEKITRPRRVNPPEPVAAKSRFHLDNDFFDRYKGSGYHMKDSEMKRWMADDAQPQPAKASGKVFHDEEVRRYKSGYTEHPKKNTKTLTNDYFKNAPKAAQRGDAHHENGETDTREFQAEETQPQEQAMLWDWQEIPKIDGTQPPATPPVRKHHHGHRRHRHRQHGQ